MNPVRRLLLVTAAASLACEAPAPSVAHIIREQVARYPSSDVADIYSMLYQGHIGPGTVDSAGGVFLLVSEIARLQAGPAEPIAEALRADSSVVRVNLRAYFAAGGSPDELAAVSVRSASEIAAEPQRFSAALRELETMAERGEVPWTPQAVRSVSETSGARRELLLHSESYLEQYRPAYRILTRERLLEALPSSARDHAFEVPPPPVPVGRFVDDYGGRHEVLPDEWRQGTTARYRIVAWQPIARYLLARNDSSNANDPGRYTRIDWIALDTPPYTWAFCFSTWNATTLAAAESVTVVKPDTPRTGCNGFPFSRLRADTTG